MIVPVMSAGSRSGVNWMRENVALMRLRQRLDRERLREARHALDQAVAAGQKADQHALDHVALADDDLADLGEHAVEERRAGRTCSASAELSTRRGLGNDVKVRNRE